MHLIYSRNAFAAVGLTMDVNGHRYVRAKAADPFLVVDTADAVAITASGVFYEKGPGNLGENAMNGFPWTDAGDVVHTRSEVESTAEVGDAIQNMTTGKLNYWTGAGWVNPDGTAA